MTFSQGGKLGQQVVELEDEAHVAVAEIREAAVVEGEDVDAGDLQAAGRGPVEGAEDVEEGALADSGGPGDGQGLTGGDVEIHPLEHRQGPGPRGVDAADPTGPQDGGGAPRIVGGEGGVDGGAHTM